MEACECVRVIIIITKYKGNRDISKVTKDTLPHLPTKVQGLLKILRHERHGDQSQLAPLLQFASDLTRPYCKWRSLC